MPILVVTLFWWWRFRHTGKLGNGLSIFLFGYFLLILMWGIRHAADQWSEFTNIAEVLIFWSTSIIGSYVFGAIGLLFLGMIVESVESVTLFRFGDDRLVIRHSYRAIRDVVNTDLRTHSIEDSRQRAIEECAAEAYEFLIEKESVILTDYDKLERLAAELSECLLMLGKKENYVG